MLTRVDLQAKRAAGAGDTPPVNRPLVFAIVAMALMMMSIDSTIVATILDLLQRDLDTSINWVGWTITAYSFGFVLMLPVSGKLAERYGQRRVFIGSVALFTLASLCCGLVDNIFVLIALRAVQAMGGAGFTPSATGIIVDNFGKARDRYVSLFGSIFPIGAMIGPIFGGLFATYWTWRGAFFVNVPIGMAVTWLALRHVPHDAVDADRRPSGMDLGGVAVLGLALLAGMLAASVLGERNATPWSAKFLVPLGVTLAAGWWFFHHIRHHAHPFIAPRLIYGRGFGAVNLFNAIYMGICNGAIVLLPLYAARRYGISTLGASTLLIAEGAAAIVLSLAAVLALRRSGYRLPLGIGGLVAAGGVALIAIRPAFGLAPYVWLALAAVLVGGGSGIFNPASRNAGLQLEPEHSAMLAALRTLSNQSGTIAMISITTAVLASASNLGETQAWTYAVAAAILVAALPTVTRVPESRGAW
ncbi:MAG TPA: MFS transporter [Rhodanobacteraceae bacterium]|nr:MFS transporter [Rhodanobacteraceae bacterium]